MYSGCRRCEAGGEREREQGEGERERERGREGARMGIVREGTRFTSRGLVGHVCIPRRDTCVSRGGTRVYPVEGHVCISRRVN